MKRCQLPLPETPANGHFAVTLFPVRRRKAEIAAEVADNLRLPVAREVREGRRFVVHMVEHRGALPMLLLALGIEVEIGGRVRQAVGEHVIPAVAVEVVDEGEKVVRRVGVLLPNTPSQPGSVSSVPSFSSR